MNFSNSGPIYLTVFIFCIFAEVVPAQQYPAPGVAIFGTAQGLKQNTITHLFKDDSGIMWVGTFAGLHRFNGYEFELLDKYNPHLKRELSNPVRDAIQHDNYLYYSTETHLFKLNLLNNQIKIVKTFNYLNPCRFFRTSSGQIFVYQFNEEGGVFKLDTEQNQFIPFYSDSVVRHYENVAQLADDLLLINESGAGWLNLNASNGELKKADLSSARYAHSISTDQLILVDDGGSARVKSATTDVPIKSSNFYKPYRVFGLNDGFAVANGNGELFFIDKNQQFQMSLSPGQLGIPEKLNGSMVNSLLQDKSGTIWMGVDGVGLIRINRLFREFNQFPSPQTKGKFVRKIAEQDSTLWVGTLGELLKYNNHEIKSYDLPFVGTGLHDLIVFDSNRLLLTIDSTLWWFDIRKEQFESIKILEEGFKLSNITKTSKGLVYISQLFGKRILELQQHKKSYVLKSIVNAPRTIKALFTLDEERQMLALSGGGYQLADFSTKTIFNEIYLSGHKITDCKFINENYWLTTDNGLIRLKHDFTPETTMAWPEPLNDEYLYGLAADNLKRLWLSSNNGLYCFDLETRQLNRFSELHGLHSNEFNTRCVVSRLDGSIAFGGVRGVNVFFPDQISIDNKAFMTVRALIENAGKPMEFGNTEIPKIDLAQNEVALRIKLNLMNFSASELNQFEYAIQTDENLNWVSLGNNPNFYLQALAPGAYRVVVRAANADGVWSETTSIFELHVSPPFYKTWWFLLLISLTVAGVAFYFIFINYKQKSERRLVNMQRQQALDAMRQRIADDIHDDLGAGLTRLTLLTRQMQVSDTDKADQYARLSGLAQSLTQSLRNVIWATKPEMDTVQSLFTAINEYAHSFLKTAEIELTVIRNIAEEDLHINPLQRQCAVLILKESLNNVVKHSGASGVSIEVNQSSSTFKLIIEDNGKGFEKKSKVNLGNGLKSMARRAIEADGEIVYETTLGGSLRVVLTLSLNHSKNDV